MHAKSRVLRLSAFAAVAVAIGSCNGGITSAPVLPVFPAVAPLASSDVSRILRRALDATDSPLVHVAVVDRTGEILGIASTASNVVQDEDNIAISLARTTAYFSNSQAPLSSRTVETLGSFHFPPTFSAPFIPSALPVSSGLAAADGASVIAPTRTPTGIVGTPQGPLWQINSTNRGAFIATTATDPDTAFNPGQEFRPSRNRNQGTVFPAPPGPSFPSPGITLLPGAVPLFKGGRLVGGIGVFVRQDATSDPDVEAAEFIAITGARSDGTAGDPNFFFDAIPLEGAITIAGVLLPYVKQTTRPAGYSAGPAAVEFISPTIDGRVDPFSFVPASTSPADIAASDASYLIGPRAAQYGANKLDVTANPTAPALSLTDVRQIIGQVVASANITRAQVRLPLGSGAKVIATIVDTRGLILAHFRMEDTLCDAVDVVPAKARSVVYFCQPGGPSATATTRTLPDGTFLDFPVGDQWPGFPTDPTGQNRGIALTTRTLGFLSQPFYPPGIDENAATPGPLFNLARLNQDPAQVDRWGTSAPDAGYQNGLTFFPGSVPLYKNGQLVGALGVSGDGVEQNDLIAFEGGAGFEPPPELRIDNFTFQGVRLPYLKFPQTPR